MQPILSSLDQPVAAPPTSSGGRAMSAGLLAVDKFERFETWLRDNGAQFDMLELREYETDDSPPARQEQHARVQAAAENDAAEEKKDPGNAKDNSSSSSSSSKGGGIDGDGDDEDESEMRGVHARVTLPPNSVCVAVPRKCLITVEMGQATPIGQAILRSDLDLDAPKHIFLMVYLLWDRKVNASRSFFAPYYAILPRTLSNMPIFWSDDELRCLEGSYLLAQIADRNDAIADDYHAICDVAPELAEIATLDEFKWARMCVCSRNFGLQIDGHRTSALVPHADMLNHYRPRETKWTFDDERQAFTITTLQTIPAGAQVYDSYGQKCNHRFLLNYGFAVEDNREIDGFCPNEVPLELGVPSDDSIYDAKYDFWTRGEGCCVPGIGGAGAGAAAGHPMLMGAGVSALAAAVTAASAARANNQDPTSVVESALEAATAAANATSAEAGLGLGGAHHVGVGGGGRGRSLSGNSSDISVPVAKRVRVCVSNNENTRTLFSMLRVLACDEIELRAIAASPPSHAGDGGCPAYVSRALLGLTAVGGATGQPGLSPDPAASSSAAASSGFYRTCRDIRHPLNLRNERRAMMHLVDVISRALAMYPTSLAQDIIDLVDERTYPRFSNRRHAKIQVRGEKEVLHHFAQWAKTALDVMEVIDRELTVERGDVMDDDGKDDVEDVASSQPGFDYVIRAMEEEEGMEGEGSLHHTIVRYCADVLGALRREEIKTIRRLKTMANTRVTRSSGISGYV